MALPLQLPFAVADPTSSNPTASCPYKSLSLPALRRASSCQCLATPQPSPARLLPFLRLRACRRGFFRRSSGMTGDTAELSTSEEELPQLEATPEDLEYIAQIKRVLELLKKNRDMIFEEVKLTIMIEDPREAERKRLLGIDTDEVTRDDLVAALEDVQEDKIPEDRLALKLLAEEMMQWPNLEVEVEKSKPKKSLYAKATDTGIDPKEAAKRLKMDWDSAAEIEEEDKSDELEVPAVVGYSALYLVSGLPILIGVSVVLILFYNSLQ